MADQNDKISLRDFTVIRDLIRDRTGIFIRDSRSDYLEYRLKDRMVATGITTFEEYYYFLKYSQDISGEFQALINLITVHETSFFRNPDQIKTFQTTVLKDLIDRKNKSGNRELKIWSAACSTGEEPVTIGIILNEAVQYPFNWDMEIVATDISTRAIEQARKSEFSQDRVKDIPAGIKEKYFSKTKNGYASGDAVNRLIKYTHLNLTRAFEASSSLSRKRFDVIFCRNVFIYFPDEVKEKITEGFYNSLNPGGYIFLGNAETIDIRKIPFKMTFLPGGMVYQKPLDK